MPITLLDALGFAGAAASLVAFSAKTMIPLRIAAITSNVLFLGYGLLGELWPSIVLNVILLPLNVQRLIAMRRLVRKVRQAAEGDFNADWLRPYMSRRSFRSGDVMFHKREEAEEVYYILSGELVFAETGRRASKGRLVGDVGIFTPDRRRTLTARCESDVEALVIGRDQLAQLYFQNPQFGFYLVQLLVGSMADHIRRLEEQLARQGSH